MRIRRQLETIHVGAVRVLELLLDLERQLDLDERLDITKIEGLVDRNACLDALRVDCKSRRNNL